MGGLSKQLARMLFWQTLVLYPFIALVIAEIVRGVLFMGSRGTGAAASGAFALYLACTVLSVLCAVALVLCWFVALRHMFLAGRMAFGVRSGLGYTGLAVVLTPWPLLFGLPETTRLDVKLAVLLIPWPGLFVIPHMIRLDVKRLLDVEPAESLREARDTDGSPGTSAEIMGFSDEPDEPHSATPSSTPESSAGGEEADVWKEIARDADRGSGRSSP